MDGWRFLHAGTEDDGLVIGGVEVWRTEWRRAEGEIADLTDPLYPEQRHRFAVYEIDGVAGPVRIAAGELSNNVWGFFVAA